MKKIFLLLILIAIPASLSLLLYHFYEPHDLHHMADIYQMVRAIESGQLPPRLGPDFTFGYGYPLFNFYYVLPFYLGALFFFTFGSLMLSFKLVFLLSIILSVFGTYLFLRQLFTSWQAFVGTTLSLYTPYRAVEVYVRGAMGEALALAILPFVCWSAMKVIKDNSKKNVLLFGIVSSLFILSHNYMWALSLPWVFGLVILSGKKIRSFLSLSIGFLVGMVLSAYWWLPAIFEQKLVRSATPFPLIDHFPFIKQLILPSWGYGASLWGPHDGMSFQIGLVNLAVVVLCFATFFMKRDNIKKIKSLYIGIWTLIGFCTIFVLMNIRTLPIWRIMPFHDFIQFPWRLLFFVPLFTGILASFLVSLYSRRIAMILGIIIVVGSIALTFNYFKPSGNFTKTDNQYLNRFFANRTLEGEKETVSQEYYNYSEDYLLLPNWTEKKPDSLPIEKISSDNGSITNSIEKSPIHWQATITTPVSSKVSFYAYYFPGWFAEVDGQNASISPEGPNGIIQMEVPAGEHTIDFYWRETMLRRIADWISLVGIIVVALLFFLPKKFFAKRYV
jgi:hypothetical protein